MTLYGTGRRETLVVQRRANSRGKEYGLKTVGDLDPGYGIGRCVCIKGTVPPLHGNGVEIAKLSAKHANQVK